MEWRSYTRCQSDSLITTVGDGDMVLSPSTSNHIQGKLVMESVCACNSVYCRGWPKHKLASVDLVGVGFL